MSSSQSEALRLPEIISSIFDAVCREPRWKHFRTLLSCTLVARLWHDEANRRLWDHCGENSDYFNIPTIEDLLALDSSKQQKFANYIRCIHICYPDLLDDELDWKGRFLPELARFSFPRLEEIDMDAPLDHDDTEYPTPVLTQFAQPSLRRIRISAMMAADSFGISEDWIIQLSQHSRGLTEFCYSDASDNPEFKISPAVFTSFLENMQSLKILEWDAEMSEDAIMVLANKTSLRQLTVSSMADTWLGDQIQSAPSGSLFQNLIRLGCEISVGGLSKLVPQLENIRILSLKIKDDTSGAIQVLNQSKLAHLRELRLETGHRDVIHAADLLSFAKGSPMLLVLDLLRDAERGNDALPILKDMNDAAMENLAQSLPQLMEIRLISIHNTEMTEQSLLFLGKHCPSLLSCFLSLSINFRTLAQESKSKGIVWKKLRELFTYGSAAESERQDNTRLLALSKKISEAMPALNQVSFQSNQDLEKALNDIID